MNAGNKQKQWLSHCKKAKLIETFVINENEKVEIKNDGRYDIFVYWENGKIVETQSENIYTKEQMKKIYEEIKAVSIK